MPIKDWPTQPLVSLLRSRKDALAAAWLTRTLLTYPEQTAHFLRQESDPFRNPVGHALATSLPALVDEVLGEMDRTRLTEALDAIIRIRAVQDFTPRQAVGFVFLLKPALREVLAGLRFEDWAWVDGRIDEVALLAFDLYMGCRERMHEIRDGERRRRLAMRAADGARRAGGNGE